MGEFGGQRDANGHNSMRPVGYLQYDFFSPEKGYLFPGTMLGKQRILAVDAGFDKQSSYRGQSANIAAAIPVFGGDEVAAQFQFIHYDGRTKFPTMADQNDYQLEAGYYGRQVKAQPFFSRRPSSPPPMRPRTSTAMALQELLYSWPELEMDGTISASFAAEHNQLESFQRVHHAVATDVLVGSEGHERRRGRGEQ